MLPPPKTRATRASVCTGHDVRIGVVVAVTPPGVEKQRVVHYSRQQQLQPACHSSLVGRLVPLAGHGLLLFGWLSAAAAHASC